MRPRWRAGLWLGAAVATLALGAGASAAELTGRLEARAVLPADTTAPGPESGAALGPGPINGFAVPFATQPVQGFSGILRAGPGVWWALPDNGYGLQERSADWLLRIYRVRPELDPPGGGTGGATVDGFVQLGDPDGKFPYPLVRPDRLLTGFDVDPESILEARDGTFWIGDEFGPWMLHFDQSGLLLDAPVALEGVRSPQNPTLAGESPTLDRSKGFEAAAPSPTGNRAFVFLEGALLADRDQRRRYVYELDLDSGRFTGRRWAYRTEDPAWLVADAKALDGRRLLVMERDDFEATGAVFKRVYEVELSRADELDGPSDDEFVDKRELVDLLALRNRDGVAAPADPGDRGLGDPFSFLLRSVESILPLDRGRLLVANDNNFPFDAGRHDGRADGNEWIVVRPTEPRVKITDVRLRPMRERVELAYELKRDARLEAEIGRRGHTLDRAARDARAGDGELDLRAPGKPGQYKLRLEARLGDTADTARAGLVVRR